MYDQAFKQRYIDSYKILDLKGCSTHFSLIQTSYSDVFQKIMTTMLVSKVFLFTMDVKTLNTIGHTTSRY